jgi:hypothetical protein
MWVILDCCSVAVYICNLYSYTSFCHKHSHTSSILTCSDWGFTCSLWTKLNFCIITYAKCHIMVVTMTGWGVHKIKCNISETPRIMMKKVLEASQKLQTQWDHNMMSYEVACGTEQFRVCTRNSLENSLWKRLWTCHKTDYALKVYVKKLNDFSVRTFKSRNERNASLAHDVLLTNDIAKNHHNWYQNF